MSEIPVHLRPRRLADWINPTDARKVHSLVDKVYQRKNLEMAWEKVKANRGSGGVDGQSLEHQPTRSQIAMTTIHASPAANAPTIAPTTRRNFARVRMTTTTRRVR